MSVTTADIAPYVSRAPMEAMPPPVTMTGALGWVRANLFSSPFNIVLTLIVALLIAWTIPPLVKFLFIDASWSGTDREACIATPTRPEAGACWAFVRERFAYFVYGSYPVAERWRGDDLLGRHAGDDRGCHRRHRGVAPLGDPARARAALAHAGGETVLGDLHR